jgi:hypothetical protein
VPNQPEPQLQSVAPAEHPTPERRGLHLAEPLLSWPFSSSRPAGLDCGTEVLPSRASPDTLVDRGHGRRRPMGCTSGSYSRAWKRLGKSLQPP